MLLTSVLFWNEFQGVALVGDGLLQQGSLGKRRKVEKAIEER